jgi:hypothetical protein
MSGKREAMMRRLAVFALGLAAVIWSPSGVARQADWLPLFDGKTLDGWQANERPESFAVEDGAIVTRGDRAHLFYTGPVANHEFKNFELMAEVMTTPGSNSGIYAHTKFQGPGFPVAGYELQVINSNPPLPKPGAYVEHKMTGSIYAIRNTWLTPAKDNEWFTYGIKVSGRTIQTSVNGDLICEYTEPANTWRPNDKKLRLLGSGTVAIQAHDPASVVRYRNIRVRLLPDDAPSLGTPIADPELDALITRLSNANYPLIDVGLKPAAGAAAARLADAARFFGMTIGPWPEAAQATVPRDGLTVVYDNDTAPDPTAALQAAKAKGRKILFSSAGAATLDAARVKRRLQAIEAAKLTWQDLWVPGKD